MRQRTERTGSATLRRLCRAALKVAASLVFTLCLMAALRYFGVPVPSPSELLEKFKGVSGLAETLS